MDADIRIARFNIRPLTLVFTKTVTDSVFDPQGNEIERTQRTLDRCRHDAECAADSKSIRPQLANSQAVDVLFLRIRAFDDVPEDARRDA